MVQDKVEVMGVLCGHVLITYGDMVDCSLVIEAYRRTLSCITGPASIPTLALAMAFLDEMYRDV